jgi:hypothetical protein
MVPESAASASVPEADGVPEAAQQGVAALVVAAETSCRTAGTQAFRIVFLSV